MQCTVGDQWNRPNLEHVILEHPILKSFHPVGRLDADTSGLLIFSRNGELSHKLLHPSSKIERGNSLSCFLKFLILSFHINIEYEAVVGGDAHSEKKYNKLQEVLAAGVKTSIGVFPLKLITAKETVRPIEPEVSLNITSDNNRDNEVNLEELKIANNITEYSSVRVTATEGKYRMIRRVLHNAGHSVLRLQRIRYGNILLDSLPVNQIRTPTINEVNWIKSIL